MKLSDKNIIITGGSKGLGFEIAKKFMSEGANLSVCARDMIGLSNALYGINSYRQNKKQILFGGYCDLSDIVSIDEFSHEAIGKFGRVDVLVNNAGIHGAKGIFENTDWDEWSKAIKVNLFGSARMCKNVLPIMKKKNSGKIIQLSGGGATKPLPTMSAYSASKSGVVRFVETIAVEARAHGVDINAIAPGILKTDLLEDILNNPETVDSEYYQKIMEAKESGNLSFEDAVNLALFLASDESNGITGKLISAKWDKWWEFPKHLDELAKSDIYTLKRISGRDRNIEWSDV